MLSDSSAVTLGLKFKPSVDGFIRGVRYYRDTANTGTHVGKLFRPAGNELASVTIPTQGAGWQSANFSSPVSVSADTTYVISYYAPNGHYSASSGYFNNPVVNLPLSSVGTGGVYANGNNFPNNSYLNTNYYVDVIFTTDEDGPPEVRAPRRTTRRQASRWIRWSRRSSIEALSTASLDLHLSGPGSTSVSGQVSYNASTRTATFTPDAELTPGVTYTAAVDATSTGGVVDDLAKTWTFSDRGSAAERNASQPVRGWDRRRLFRLGMTAVQ